MDIEQYLYGPAGQEAADHAAAKRSLFGMGGLAYASGFATGAVAVLAIAGGLFATRGDGPSPSPREAAFRAPADLPPLPVSLAVSDMGFAAPRR
ncbi:MAG: hypothetical protein ACK4NE_07675 [Albidovulum sp.]